MAQGGGGRMRASFSVPFVRGKARVRFSRATGRAYTPDATSEAMERIRQAYAASGCPMAPPGAEVSVSVTTVRPLPKSRPKRVEREPDIYKPDADNIGKLVLDALNGIAWADDAQVTEIYVGKAERMRGLPEQTYVWIEWKEDGDGD